MYTSRDNQRVDHFKRSREDKTRRQFRENVNKRNYSNTICHFKSRGTSRTGLRILSVIEIFLPTGRIPESYSSPKF